MTQRRFMDLLAIPWVDKSIALVATIPFVIELYRRWVVGHVTSRVPSSASNFSSS